MEATIKWLTMMTLLWQSSKYSSMVEAAQRNGPECKLPLNRGTCEKNIIRYFYDTQAGECRAFTYTGCGGNLNNYMTQEDCNFRCICLKSKILGTGTQNLTRYFYNAELKQCEAFTFGGTGGNTNNFINKRICEDLCVDQVLKESCTLRPDYGRTCGQHSTQYYYDQNSNSCRPFKYGGCDGNTNRFPSSLACELVCKQIVITTQAPVTPSTSAPTTTISSTTTTTDSTTSTVSPTTSTEASTTTATTPTTSSTTPATTTTASNRPARCNLPRKRGNCGRRIPRFYFDVKTGRCGWFVYSGCGGNRNNFVRYRQCRRKCINVRPLRTTSTTTSTTSTTSATTTTPTTTPSTTTEPSTTSSTTTIPTTTSSTTIAPTTTLSSTTTVPSTTTSSTTTVPSTTSSTTTEPSTTSSTTTVPSTTSSSTTTEPSTTSSTATPSTTTSWFVPVRCLLQPDQGPCDQVNMRYYYDVNQKACAVFTYSGCGGNGNNFFGLSECVDTCSKNATWTSSTSTTTTTTTTTTAAPTTTTQAPLPAQCRQPVNPGRCPFRLLRFYYDQTLKTCRPFTFTGCFGNSNNFIRKENCEYTCNVTS